MKKRTLVIVDAGHGKETLGKRSPNGVLREYAWNRDCAKVLIEWVNHIPFFEAYYITPEENEEDVPLKTRVERANNIYKTYSKDYNVLLISIHCNAFGDGVTWNKAHGWSIYTSKGFTESDSIATAIHSAAVAKFGKKNVGSDMSDGDPDFEENFYILRKTICPAVLIEHFFMTNREDYEYLISPDSIYDCVEVITNGLKNYYHELLVSESR